MKKFPLMKNNITKNDLSVVSKYFKKNNPILTSNKNVSKFERLWSAWLGVKYSVFVNSGSSSNLLAISILKNLNPNGGEIIVPALTWSSDISSIIHTGFKPIFVDIELNTLSLSTKKILNAITKKTVAVFLSHIQGFSGLSDELIITLKKKKIPLIEDVCESHGATHNGKKLGTYGLMSNFSFYYAHHMSTIEGGMLCTNNENVYQMARMIRAHGLVRESTSKKIINQYRKKYPDLNPEFIFSFPAFNFRNNEIGALIGINQLKRLNKNIIERNKNHILFLKFLNDKNFFKDFKINGSSNYAFNLVLKNKNKTLFKNICKNLKKNKIEFRIGSAGGGNQLRQPYLKNLINLKPQSLPETDHVHFYGMYIGNYPGLTKKDIKFICDIINKS